ncbi:MAG: filamentous hemagglutinin N-terminal domain-containing protein [Rhizobiales bacterium]|nr:filamentous hemagglutinin N-terminal domain-containing protein [Hyphomicrobiales bacterium]
MGRSASTRAALLASATYLTPFLLGIGLSGSAQADGTLPTGGEVVSGSAAIAASPSGNLRVDQSSPTAILNWQSFSIGAGNSVTFANGSGATLNRVTGFTPSQIDGLLSASGSVYLVNPSGIVIGSSGVISTGGSFIASTLDVSDAEFNAQGAMTFKGDSQAAVINYGSIGALGGDVALIARKVGNEGTITAPNGTAALAAGYEVLMRDAALSDGKFLVKVGGGDTEASTSGVIHAANVELRANGGNVYALAGNTSSITKATGVASKGGRIFLTAGDGGSVKVTQKLSAKRSGGNGKSKGGDIRISGGDVALSAMLDAAGEGGGDGGTIVATGKGVSILATAKLDVSGALGGVILVGGDYQGGTNADTKYLAQAVANAQTTSVAAGAILDASGSEGAGGNVVVWSDQHTQFAGTILSTGSGSGAGGDAEVSGKAVLDFTGTVDLSSASGAFGWLLLDPYNLTIWNGASSGMSGFNANADDSVLSAAALVAALDGANVKVTTGSGGSQAGDITVDAVINWNSSSTLELSAYHDIVVNWNISSPGGGALVLRADNTGTGAGTVSFGTAGTHLFTYGGVTIYYNPSSYANPTDYSGNAGGGVPLTAYMLVNNVDQLQAINTNLNANYALGRDIDASAALSFTPIGADSSHKFGGLLDGQGHVIDGLTVSGTGAGLFGCLDSGGEVRNLGLTNESITGTGSDAMAGGIAYYSLGTISNVYVTGTIASGGVAGGIVGVADGNSSISNSYSTAAVKGTYAGGLVGYSVAGGSISQSYASGSVTAVGQGPYAGGLVGFGTVTITNSYWDKDSTGQANAVGTGSAVLNNVVGIDASNRYNQSTYANLDFGSTWYMIDGETRPFLRSEYQTTITNAHQLQLIALDLGATYALGADVDASATDGANAADMWSTRGFVPLGTDSDGAALNANNGFYGTLDGQGHVIDKLAIDRPDRDSVALFGRAGNATILDLGLTHIDVTGKGTVGGLVGFSVAASGELSVARTYVTGKVTSTGSVAGGLFGYLYAAVDGTAKIEQSYADVMIQGGALVGGLVGHAFGGYGGTTIIADSYAVGSVSGSSDVGGLVGRSDTYSSGTVTIERSYAANQVTGTSTVGGLVGYDGGTTSYSGNFWDTLVTDQSCGVGTACAGITGVTGLTMAQFQDTASFMTLASAAGWDFDTVWAPPSAGYYPELYAVTPVVWVRSATASSTYGDSTATVTSTSGAGGPNSYVFGPDGDSLNPLGTSIAIDPTLSAGDHIVTLANGNSSQTSAGGVTYRVFTYHAGSTVSVDKATLTVTADNGQMNYGDTPSLGYSVSGWKNSQTDALLTGVDVSTNATALSNVGNGYITSATGGALGGAATGNYTITYVNGSFEVKPATLTVTADNGQMDYGDTPSLGYSVSGWKNSQTDALLTGVGVSTDATALSNVGDGYITSASGGSLGGAATGNYVLSYVNGSFEVKPATLTVTADDGSMIYGNSVPSLGYSVSGWKNGQGDNLLTGVGVSTDATSSSNVGTSYVTIAANGTLGGAAAGNYVLTYENGAFDVTTRALTVTADAQSMIYGNSVPALTYDIGGMGLVNGDQLSGGLATSASSMSNVGAYAITQGSLAASSNYALTYVGNDMTVTPRALTVAADAQSMIYGNSVPGLTYDIGGMGLVNGDQLSGGLATTASSTSNVGAYTITQGSLAASSNYALTYVGSDVTVTPRPLTLTANDQSRGVGTSNPPLTYAAGGMGLVNGDTLTGQLTTTATYLSQPGAYAIAQGSLAASGNYDVRFVAGTLVVTSELPVGEWRPVYQPPTDNWLETIRMRAILAAGAAQGEPGGERAKSNEVCAGGSTAQDCPAVPYPDNLPRRPWLRFVAAGDAR